MAYFPGLSLFGDRQSSSSLVFEEFVPPSAWTEDSTCHYLLVDLPGFKKQELKLEVDNQTHILVSGERQVRENKYKRFEQRYELPNNADIEKITGKLDGEILYISVPKKPHQEHKEVSHGSIEQQPSPSPSPSPSSSPVSSSDDVEDGDEHDEDKKLSEVSELSDDVQELQEHKEINHHDKKDNLERKKYRPVFEHNWSEDADLYMRFAKEKLRNNKGIVVTAIVAFSLGVLVAQKLQSNGQ